MGITIFKVNDIGFCFGVRRAIKMLNQAAQQYGELETLGAVVHNEQVLKDMAKLGIKVIDKPDEIISQAVAISSHGVSPQVELEIKAHNINLIDTTCPSVKHAQKVACFMSESGYFVVVFGDSLHPEVQGILGWTNGNSLATLDLKPLVGMNKLPKKIGILSQTTQIPDNFTRFIKQVIDTALSDSTEIRIVDTICRGVRIRQTESLKLAQKVDLMLVIGGRNSANTKRLFEICSNITETYLINEAKDISVDWLKGKNNIGITSGTSTSDSTIDQVIKYLNTINI